MRVMIVAYVAAGLAWGLAYWLGLRDGRAEVSRRAAWARALGMFLLLAVAFGVRDVSAVLVSTLVLPSCYLLGWNRMARSRVGMKAAIL